MNADRAYLMNRKLSWRKIGLRCLHSDNLKGFHRAYEIARLLTPAARNLR